MTWRRFVVVGLLGLGLGPAVQAGLFSKKPQEAPAQRVTTLIGTLRTDPSEGKRESAAEELRQFDPQQYPEIVPVLLEALQHDAKPGVRAESALSLGKLRPVTSEVGAALEQALTKDGAARVRVQVRTALWEYRLAGYHAGKVEAPPTPAPAAPTKAEPPIFPTSPSPTPLPPPPVVGPRLTPSPAVVTQPSPAAVAQPLPVGPPPPIVKPPLVPTDPPVLETPPLSAPDAGPTLVAPQ